MSVELCGCAIPDRSSIGTPDDPIMSHQICRRPMDHEGVCRTNFTAMDRYNVNLAESRRKGEFVDSCGYCQGDAHRCPGCGEPLNHKIHVCGDCLMSDRGSRDPFDSATATGDWVGGEYA